MKALALATPVKVRVYYTRIYSLIYSLILYRVYICWESLISVDVFLVLVTINSFFLGLWQQLHRHWQFIFYIHVYKILLFRYEISNFTFYQLSIVCIFFSCVELIITKNKELSQLTYKMHRKGLFKILSCFWSRTGSLYETRIISDVQKIDYHSRYIKRIISLGFVFNFLKFIYEHSTMKVLYSYIYIFKRKYSFRVKMRK